MAFNYGAQVRVFGRMHGVQTVNVLNFGSEAPFNRDNLGVDLNQLLTFVLECIVESLLPAITQDWTLEKLTANLIAPENSDEFVLVPPGDRVGTQGPASHSFAASMIEVRTGGGGKSGRGRNFWPPTGEAQTTASNIDGPTLVFLANFINCMTLKFIGANSESHFKIGVFSRLKFAGTFANFNTAFRPATVLVAAPLVARMGSRKVGRGS